MKNYIGRFARSIESGWLGKVVGVDTEHNGIPLGCTMLHMQGVNELVRTIKGGDIVIESVFEGHHVSVLVSEGTDFKGVYGCDVPGIQGDNRLQPRAYTVPPPTHDYDVAVPTAPYPLHGPTAAYEVPAPGAVVKINLKDG